MYFMYRERGPLQAHYRPSGFPYYHLTTPPPSRRHSYPTPLGALDSSVGRTLRNFTNTQYATQNIISFSGIHFLLDLSCKFFRHLVGITIGTSCAPFSVSIFCTFCDFYFYKATLCPTLVTWLAKSIICQLTNLTKRGCSR